MQAALFLHFMMYKKPLRRGSLRKTVHDCYSMGLSACGCETRAAPSNSLATTALFTSWNNANALNVFSALPSTLNAQLLALS
jgi:hypothetical protein